MKTRSGWFHLRGLFLLTVGFAFGALLCASANAGPLTYRESPAGQPHKAQEMPAQKAIKIFVLTSASAIPKPISYVIGGVMTTATPVQIIGRGQTVNR